MIFDIGPFRLYRVEKNGTLDISLKCLEDWPCGWEYGWRDGMRSSEEKPVIEFRIGKLMVAFLEFYPGGLEVWFMGFWAFINWREPDWKKK